MYGLSKNADAIVEALENIRKTAIAQDIAENGIDAIIDRELANHEAQITGSIADTVDALEGYDIPKERIAKRYREVFLPHCIENDLF